MKTLGDIIDKLLSTYILKQTFSFWFFLRDDRGFQFKEASRSGYSALHCFVTIFPANFWTLSSFFISVW